MTDSPDPAVVAGRFVEAIAWGEHTVVWDLLSRTGRGVALSVALTNGLDRVVAARISDDVADPTECQAFLEQLLRGLRRDLRSVDLAHLHAESPAVIQDDGTAIVELTCPSAIPGTGSWSAGRLVLSSAPDGTWRIDRLEPIIAGP
ncbi:MAG: hypothetical protein ABIP17_02430 [Ilumatobacteraceae bacterium]